MDIKLNRYHLDQNAIDQVEMYEDCTNQWADAIFERDTEKENLTVIKAEVDETVRAKPKAFGWDSESKPPTETWISNCIVLNEQVRKATTKYLASVHKVNNLAGRKETLEHRKKALEILTDLYQGQYFVAVSRTDNTYKKAVSEKGQEAQVEALNNSERLRKRRSA